MNVVTPDYIHAETVNIVSGLPRSGTSMMMRMCEKGGLPPLTDNVRSKDDMNPNGYYEFEAVKDSSSYNEWLKDASGKVLKVISRFLPSLPSTYFYKVVFVHRPLNEIIRSQANMASKFKHDKKWAASDGEQLSKIYTQHLVEISSWLRDRPNISVLEVRYEDVINDPLKQSQRIASFLHVDLDPKAMASVVNRSLNHAVPAPLRYETIIFDLDGVIICSLPVIREAYYAAHRKVVGGTPPPFSEYQRLFGRSFPEIMKILGLPVEMHEVFKKESNRRMSKIEVYPGIRTMLKTLQDQGIKMIVATGKDSERAQATLDYLDLSPFFDMVVGSDQVDNPKPAPDMALKALKTFGIKPNQALFCGDALADMQCGRGANVSIAAVMWGEPDRNVLLAENPDYVLEKPDDLLNLVIKNLFDA